MVNSTQPVLVGMSHIRKSFSGITVLDDVSFEVKSGEVHALAGGNGAGKSTLMKILQGVYSLDSGQMTICGTTFNGSVSIAEARQAGVGMVFQEFSLVPTMSIAQNIFMGSEKLQGVFLDKQAMNRATVQLLNRLDVDLHPDTEVGELSTGYWQLTEIAKALHANARVLILDEPTASLSATETQTLFDLIRNLKSQGIGIIYISHRMDEIRQIADRITILRNGRNYLTSDLDSISDEEIIAGIVGHQTDNLSKRESRVCLNDEVLLKLDHLHTENGVENVSLEVHRGEVVGLAGLMGSGRTEVTRAIFGVDRVTSGSMTLSGKTYSPKRPQEAIANNISLVPEDRREQGLFTGHSVCDNLVITRYDECERAGLLSNKSIETLVDNLVKGFSIKVDDTKTEAYRLSGGNQQKIVIAKWLGKDPDLFIMDEPTAGIDIGTKREVLDQVAKLAEQGKGVLFISSELSEMVAVCDRYVVMKHGRTVGELPAEGINNEADLQLAIQHSGTLNK